MRDSCFSLYLLYAPHPGEVHSDSHVEQSLPPFRHVRRPRGRARSVTAPPGVLAADGAAGLAPAEEDSGTDRSQKAAWRRPWAGRPDAAFDTGQQRVALSGFTGDVGSAAGHLPSARGHEAEYCVVIGRGVVWGRAQSHALTPHRWPRVRLQCPGYRRFH